MLIDQVKSKLLTARKARDAAATATLTTLVGEVETFVKAGRGELSDAVVVSVIKKLLKANGDTQGHLIDQMSPDDGFTPKGAVALMNEAELLQSLLPKQLTSEELEALIDAWAANGSRDIGDVMKRLKAEHGGCYDGALASKLLKERYGR